MMPDIGVNLWAVLGCVAFSMALGSLWYGPLFGKRWMALLGMSAPMTPEQKKKGQKAVLCMVLISFVTAYILAYMVQYTLAATWMEGAQTGFWIWLGFQATMIVGGVLFENRKKELALINGGYHLVSLMVMGAILAVWA